MITATHNKNLRLYFIIIVVLIPALFITSVAVGSVSIPFAEVWKILCGGESKNSWTIIVLKTRLPESFTALMAGAGLSVAGLMLQTLFRNPLAGPSVLGISSAASLGVVVFTVSAANFLTDEFSGVSTVIAACMGSLLLLMLISYLSHRIAHITTILIAGMMLSFFLASIESLVLSYATADEVKRFVGWGFGSFSNVRNNDLYYFSGLISATIVVAVLQSKRLDALQFGNNFASSVGVQVKSSTTIIILITGIITGIITAWCGPIAFIGLCVPHIVKIFLQTNRHFVLLTATALTGMAVALLCAIITRLPIFSHEVPLNTVTSALGAPIVLYLIFSKNKINFYQ